MGHDHRTSKAVVLIGCPTAAVSSAGYAISDPNSKFDSDMVAYVITSYVIGEGRGWGGGRLLLYQGDSSWRKKKKKVREESLGRLGLVRSSVVYPIVTLPS